MPCILKALVGHLLTRFNARLGLISYGPGNAASMASCFQKGLGRKVEVKWRLDVVQT